MHGVSSLVLLCRGAAFSLKQEPPLTSPIDSIYSPVLSKSQHFYSIYNMVNQVSHFNFQESVLSLLSCRTKIVFLSDFCHAHQKECFSNHILFAKLSQKSHVISQNDK